ncbi:MAG: hypothetical protein HY959_14075 [Ignavibacteriae bacterium]|nr:hypothetical protein [Ignavibacteriota bacterium]
MINTDKIKSLHERLQFLKKEISKEKAKSISKKEIRKEAEHIGEYWFSGLADELYAISSLEKNVLDYYSDNFSRLIKISAPNNLKTSYEDSLKNILKKFRDELIIPLQKNPTTPSNETLLTKILGGLPNQEENEYLIEAIKCATNGYYRAAVILGWCAAIDRIQKKIEKIGFEKFNITSASLSSKTVGRFKRFNSTQNINSLSELREVFDTIVLWIIEGIGLIDSNQHTRLKGCFDLRCQCAHPGDAPITEYNLLSFFSDLNEIVFRNTKFAN